MKNKPDFVPKSFKYQPREYRKIFNCWTAVFEARDGKEFHVGIINDWHYPENGNGVEVLKQNDNGRMPLTPDPFKSIKAALQFTEKLLDRYSA